MKRFLFTVVQIIWGAPQTLLGLVLYAATAGQPRFSYHGALGTVWKYASSVSLGLFIFVAENPLKQGLVIAEGSTRSAPRSESTPGAPHGESGQVKATYVDQRLVAHEFGHCIQSLIFGPLYLVIFGLPSLVWAMLPTLRKRRTRANTSYYSFYTERFANFLVERITHETPLR